MYIVCKHVYMYILYKHAFTFTHMYMPNRKSATQINEGSAQQRVTMNIILKHGNTRQRKPNQIAYKNKARDSKSGQAI